jgi:GDP-L-fucose synthase
MEKEAKIYVAGHNGLVGSAVIRKLTEQGYKNILTADSKHLDLRNQYNVKSFFESKKPDYVFLCAGKVGGIMANVTYPADFLYDNVLIQFNVIDSAYKTGVKKLLALGSSCIYPKDCNQPIKEEYLLSSYLEPTNEPYAIAKIAALKMCDAYRQQYGCNFISAMPTNLYGEKDNYDLEKSHVIPALIRKVMVAKEKNEDVIIWGTGNVRREFLYSDDCAEACLFLMRNYNQSGHINVGTGIDIVLNDALSMIIEIVGFKGKVIHDTTKPDGMKIKCLDVSKINNFGWQAKTTLYEGLQKTIKSLNVGLWLEGK